MTIEAKSRAVDAALNIFTTMVHVPTAMEGLALGLVVAACFDEAGRQRGSKRPVAFRVRGLSGWVVYADEAEAAKQADVLRTDYEGLYSRAPADVPNAMFAEVDEPPPYEHWMTRLANELYATMPGYASDMVRAWRNMPESRRLEVGSAATLLLGRLDNKTA